jgi:hypothetical protein
MWLMHVPAEYPIRQEGDVMGESIGPRHAAGSLNDHVLDAVHRFGLSSESASHRL